MKTRTLSALEIGGHPNCYDLWYGNKLLAENTEPHQYARENGFTHVLFNRYGDNSSRVKVKELESGVTIAKTNLPNQHSIRWSVSSRGQHTVRYGYQAKKFSKKDSIAAAHEYGECVRHAAECEGLLD